MRILSIIVFTTVCFAGCAQTPPPEPVVVGADNRALHPSRRTFGFTDAQVQAMQEKLATIQYPAPPGETVRVLGLGAPAFSSLEILDYAANDANLAAAHRRRAPLNGRYELVIVEHQYVAQNGNRAAIEQSATIRRIAP